MKRFIVIAAMVGLCSACTPCEIAAVASQQTKDRQANVTTTNHGPYRPQEDDADVVAAFKRCQAAQMACSIERQPDGSLEVIGVWHVQIGTAIQAHS